MIDVTNIIVIVVKIILYIIVVIVFGMVLYEIFKGLFERWKR